MIKRHAGGYYLLHNMHDTTVTNCLGWNASSFSPGNAEIAESFIRQWRFKFALSSAKSANPRISQHIHEHLSTITGKKKNVV
jgi:hypothetical protein